MLHLRKAFYDMAKILITGNGFDLFHHLPTKYHHFISIMQTIENNVYATDVSFEELFGEVFKEKYQSDYNSIVENYNSVNIKFSSEKLDRIKQLLETNLWYKHFRNALEIDTWIDFEVEVEIVLNQLTIFENQNKRAIENNLFSDAMIIYTSFETFNIIEGYGVKGDFRLNGKYINQRHTYIDMKKILHDLKKSFEDFIVIFNLYLVDVVSVFYSEIKEKSVIPFHLLDEIYTFNYTPTLENFYKVDKSKIVYLHGKIHEDCQKQNLVLGIHELPKHVRVSKMFDFTKYYQRINKKSNKKFIDIPEQKSHSLDENIFYIIGHSLDDSDKEYISDLFKFLDFDLRKNAKICVFYFNSRDMENKLRNLFSIIDKDIVVSMDKDDRLYFVELNDKNIAKEFERQTYKYQAFF